MSKKMAFLDTIDQKWKVAVYNDQGDFSKLEGPYDSLKEANHAQNIPEGTPAGELYQDNTVVVSVDEAKGTDPVTEPGVTPEMVAEKKAGLEGQAPAPQAEVTAPVVETTAPVAPTTEPSAPVAPVAETPVAPTTEPVAPATTEPTAPVATPEQTAPVAPATETTTTTEPTAPVAEGTVAPTTETAPVAPTAEGTPAPEASTTVAPQA